ncbi:MAG TPA: choice-of-anchor tandem repeat GloVer-containing protein [Terriglobales bacterium]|jgi:uncharacterized repeat protein (TIGR03803 family)|nr:choice-of-anchor tandem repeat GloVer-containing protein [Terriglobales bacterium]
MKKACSYIVVMILGCGFAVAQHYQVLYNFGTNGGNNDGLVPYGGLVFDAAGNMYGTTVFGGETYAVHDPACPSGCGTVFELSPVAGGGWSEKVLHSFDGQDGQQPASALIIDTQGNLYGTTTGSDSYSCVAPACGTVFELSSSGGTWTETILYAFADPMDGADPSSALVSDSAGNLYGVTFHGGANDGGFAFELSPPSLPGGSWTYTVVYAFCQVGGMQCLDGRNPAGLTFDGHGNLFGTTEIGGLGHYGVVYELSPTSGGTWAETVLHNFNRNLGMPVAGVTLDHAGNLYGTLESGGLSGPGCAVEGRTSLCGGAFRMTPKNGGGWYEASFLFNGSDGGNPYSGLVVDGSSVYGTTNGGGNGLGVVFRFTGKHETVLYTFCTQGCTDGDQPGAVIVNAGALYGVTEYGGAYDRGVVFEITP